MALEACGHCGSEQKEDSRTNNDHDNKIKELVSHLEAPSKETVTVLRNIGQFVGRGPKERDEAFECGIVEKLACLLDSQGLSEDGRCCCSVAVLEMIAWVIAQLSSSDEANAYPAQTFKPLMPRIIDLLKMPNQKVQEYVAEALSSMSFLMKHKDPLIQSGVVPLLVDLLLIPGQQDKISEGAYYALGNLAYANKERAEHIAKQKALRPIVQALEHTTQTRVLTRCAAALRHICYNSETGTEEAASSGAFRKVFSLLCTDNGKHPALDTLKTLALSAHSVRHIVNPDYSLVQELKPLLTAGCSEQSKAVLVLTNIINTVSSQQIQSLVEQGILDLFPELLDTKTDDVKQDTLACIIVILKKGGATHLSYAQTLRENGTLAKTRELQKHPEKHIWGISAKICELCQERLAEEQEKVVPDKEESIIVLKMKEEQENRSQRSVKTVRPLSQRDSNALTVLQSIVVDPEEDKTKELTQSITQTLNDVVMEIGSRDPRLRGVIRGVGSHYDLTKTPPADEQDYVYVLTSEELQDLNIVRAHSQELLFYVHHYKGEGKEEWADLIPSYAQIHSLKLYKKFCQLVGEAFTKISLPPGLEFGGICSPSFSGLRENHPAMTVQFVYDGKPVHIDLSVGIPIAMDKVNGLSDQSKKRVEVLKDMNVEIQMLLVPTDSVPFKLGTTLVENGLIRNMSTDSPLKSSIILCKYLNSKAFTVHAPLESASDVKKIELVMHNKVKQMIENDQVAEEFEGLLNEGTHNTDPTVNSFGPEEIALFVKELKTQDRNHKDLPSCMEKLLKASWILRQGVHPHVQELCEEREKEFVTSASCVFKYKAMEYYLDGQITDKDTGLDVCIRILQDFLGELQAPERSHRFKHPLLGYNLNLKSFSPYLVSGHVKGLDITAVKQAHVDTIRRVLELLATEQ